MELYLTSREDKIISIQCSMTSIGVEIFALFLDEINENPFSGHNLTLETAMFRISQFMSIFQFFCKVKCQIFQFSYLLLST
jgi:hypothetical protein